MRFVRDTGLLRRWHIEAPWTSGGQYTLTIPKGAITDVAGFSNDSIVRKYTVLDPEKFATVKIHVKGKDDKAKYILQLLDGSNALKQEKRDVTTGDWQFNYVPAGEIKFRIIEDMNGNGKWDTGNASSEIRMWICGAHGPNRKETGLLEELQLDNLYFNPELHYTIWDDVMYNFVRQQPNLSMLLNSSVESVEVEDGKITFSS